jgi:5'-nucleotidase, C-terminal domain
MIGLAAISDKTIFAFARKVVHNKDCFQNGRVRSENGTSALVEGSSDQQNAHCVQPMVPFEICHGRTCEPERQSGSDVCTTMAYMLLAAYPRHDVVLLPTSTCQGPMPAGRLLYHETLVRIVPTNDAVVTVTVTGAILHNALEYSIKHSLSQQHGGHPVQHATSGMMKIALSSMRPAGIRFPVNTLAPGRTLIPRHQVQVLSSHGCQWKPLRPRQSYQVLTVQSMLFLFDEKTESRWDAGIRNVFWSVAKKSCMVRDPFYHAESSMANNATRPIEAMHPLVAAATWTFRQHQQQGNHSVVTEAIKLRQ